MQPARVLGHGPADGGNHLARGIRPAIEWAIKASEDSRVPVLVEIIVERETDAAMGKSIDNITEYEPIEEGDQALTQFADNIPERD